MVLSRLYAGLCHAFLVYLSTCFCLLLVSRFFSCYIFLLIHFSFIFLFENRSNPFPGWMSFGLYCSIFLFDYLYFVNLVVVDFSFVLPRFIDCFLLLFDYFSAGQEIGWEEHL